MAFFVCGMSEFYISPGGEFIIERQSASTGRNIAFLFVYFLKKVLIPFHFNIAIFTLYFVCFKNDFYIAFISTG